MNTQDPGVTTEPTIPAAIIEKAARAMFQWDIEDHSIPRPTWEMLDEHQRAVWLSGAVATLSAVYADIKAEAIRDVHAAIQAVLDGDSLMAQLLRMDCNSTARDAVGWTQSTLSACADELEGVRP